MGTLIQDEEPQGGGLRRPRARGLQREPGPHPARADPRHPPRLLRRRRGRGRDRHLRRPPRWCWPSTASQDSALAHQRPGGRARPRGGGRVPRRPTGGRAGSPAPSARRPRRSASPAASTSTRCSRPSPCRPRGWSRAASDYLLIETAQDTRNVKAALLGCERAFAKVGRRIPVAVSGTIEPMGTMLAGQSVEALATSVEHAELLYLGLNCATGPEFMTDHIRSLCRLTAFPVGCVPNAGLPDENGHYLETPAMLARALRRFAEEGWLNVVGGCCGTTAEHIRAIAEAVRGLAPRSARPRRASRLSGVDYLEVGDDVRPVIVGERTNVIGSRKFKDLIVAEQLEDASEIARAQVKRGAQVIDICLANPDRDELRDMRAVPGRGDQEGPRPADDRLHRRPGGGARRSPTARARRSSTRSTSRTARSASRRWSRSPAATAPRWSSAASTRSGMAVTRERKLEVAERSHALLTGKYGVRPRRTSTSTRWCSPAPRATSSTSAARWRPSRACGPSSSASRAARRCSASPTCPSACPPPAARC